MMWSILIVNKKLMGDIWAGEPDKLNSGKNGGVRESLANAEKQDEKAVLRKGIKPHDKVEIEIYINLHERVS